MAFLGLEIYLILIILSAVGLCNSTRTQSFINSYHGNLRPEMPHNVEFIVASFGVLFRHLIVWTANLFLAHRSVLDAS